MEDAGSLDPQAVRDALASLDISTFYGVLRFDGRGANVYKQMVVQQIQQSRHHSVYPAAEADARIAYPTPPWSQRP
jgi:branched-chain amino acid transport system substrate-binding protein